MRILDRLRAHVAAVYAEERDAQFAAVVAERCPECNHARGEQERPDMGETVAQWSLRARRRPVRAARCGATAGMAHVLTPCGCRAPFHGS